MYTTAGVGDHLFCIHLYGAAPIDVQQMKEEQQSTVVEQPPAEPEANEEEDTQQAEQKVIRERRVPQNTMSRIVPLDL